MRHIFVALVMVLLLVGVFSMPTFAAEPLVVSGCSVSNFGYLTDLARDYEKETGQKILVRGGGSLLGLTELGESQIDFAASCKSKDITDPPEFIFYHVAWDALVFIVNKSNPVSNITMDNVRDIYNGKITNWRQLGGKDMEFRSYITTTAGMGGVGEALTNMVLGGAPVEKKVNSVMLASSTAVWEQLTEREPAGFASAGFASSRRRNVKMLMVAGVPPTKQNIISGKYPLKRRLFLVARQNARPEVQAFIDWALGKKGQSLISSYGIPSLAEIK